VKTWFECVCKITSNIMPCAYSAHPSSEGESELQQLPGRCQDNAHIAPRDVGGLICNARSAGEGVGVVCCRRRKPMNGASNEASAWRLDNMAARVYRIAGGKGVEACQIPT
jgi:hypothetical protein